MKSAVTLFFALFAALLAIGCVGCGDTKATPENPNDPSFETLLAQARMESAKIEVVYYQAVPDSLKDKMATWITETTKAASFHMTGGDYEDPEDLVDKVVDVAKDDVFSRHKKDIYLCFLPQGKKYEDKVKPEDLTPSQRRVYDYLNR